MLIPILIVLALTQTNAAVLNQVKRDNVLDFATEPIDKVKFFARNFAEVFVKQKPVDFSRLKSLSNLDLSKILDNVLKLNQAVANNNVNNAVSNVTASPSKVVEVKPVKVFVSNSSTTQIKAPSFAFTSLKVVENRPRFDVFRGVFDGFKSVLRSKLPRVFKKRPLLDSLISSSIAKPQNTTAKNKVIHEHKIVFIKAKIPILTGNVLSMPDDRFELIEVRPLNETLSFNNLTNSSGFLFAEKNPETKNITFGTLFSTFNVTVPQFITSINNLTLPLPISHIFGFMAKKKLIEQQTEKFTRLNRPVIFLGRFPTKERQTRQFNEPGFGGGGFGGGGFGGGAFMGGGLGFHHRGGSNFNNNNLNGGGFGAGVNFNNNNLNGGGGLGSNFNNNNLNDFGGGVNFNNNNGR